MIKEKRGNNEARVLPGSRRLVRVVVGEIPRRSEGETSLRVPRERTNASRTVVRWVVLVVALFPRSLNETEKRVALVKFSAAARKPETTSRRREEARTRGGKEKRRKEKVDSAALCDNRALAFITMVALVLHATQNRPRKRGRAKNEIYRVYATSALPRCSVHASPRDGVLLGSSLPGLGRLSRSVVGHIAHQISSADLIQIPTKMIGRAAQPANEIPSTDAVQVAFAAIVRLSKQISASYLIEISPRWQPATGAVVRALSLDHQSPAQQVAATDLIQVPRESIVFGLSFVHVPPTFSWKDRSPAKQPAFDVARSNRPISFVLRRILLRRT